MGRKLILIGIWLVGFILGFGGYLVYPALADFVVHALPFLLGIDANIAGAFVSGLATSFITLIVVSLWAYGSRSRGYF